VVASDAGHSIKRSATVDAENTTFACRQKPDATSDTPPQNQEQDRTLAQV